MPTRILRAEENAKIALEQAQETLTANLTVGVLATIAASLVPPALETLSRRHPGVAVKTREVSPEDTFVAVRNGDLDLTFVLDYPDAPMALVPGLQSTLIGVEQSEIAVGTHLLACNPRLQHCGLVKSLAWRQSEGILVDDDKIRPFAWFESAQDVFLVSSVGRVEGE